MPHTDFSDRFRSAYTGKILTTVSALKRRYGDTYRIVFDDRPDDFRNNTLQGRFSLILKEDITCGAQAVKFIIMAEKHTRGIMITSIKYDSAGRGLDGKKSLFFGSLEDFRKLNLEELVVQRIRSENRVQVNPSM